jgi:hypothetical protein
LRNTSTSFSAPQLRFIRPGSRLQDERMWTWFRKVIFTCTVCRTVQRIPVRRVHVFERFHNLDGRALLIRCSRCRRGLQIPGSYRSYTGRLITINPANPPKDALIHDSFC